VGAKRGGKSQWVVHLERGNRAIRNPLQSLIVIRASRRKAKKGGRKGLQDHRPDGRGERGFLKRLGNKSLERPSGAKKETGGDSAPYLPFGRGREGGRDDASCDSVDIDESEKKEVRLSISFPANRVTLTRGMRERKARDGDSRREGAGSASERPEARIRPRKGTDKENKKKKKGSWDLFMTG